MSINNFMDSRYWQWYVNHKPFAFEQEQALQREALNVLVESVNAGEITALDGVHTPLSKQIKAHHGLDDFEMNSNWLLSAQDWICPCCMRSKFQISRAGKQGQILAKLVVHHDHMSEAMQAAFHEAFESAGTNVEQVEGLRLVERMGKAFAAYEEVLICEDCNNADTEAKKQVLSPRYFSFSIRQIKQFINIQDHHSHRLDVAKAEQIWREAKPAYELRMKLIHTVAYAAATDTHWYEPYARGTDAIPVLGVRQETGDHAIKQWVSTERLQMELGPRRKLPTANLSRWRTVSQKCGKPLPDNFLAMLRSDEVRARAWDLVPDGWCCPICMRDKHQTVYVGEKGKIRFYPRTTTAHGKWSGVTTICNHCESTLMSLKLEISKIVGKTPSNNYGFVSPAELAKIITARPHSSHLIQQAEAEELVSTVVERLTH